VTDLPVSHYLGNPEGVLRKHTRYCRSKGTRRSITPCAIKRALDTRSSRLLVQDREPLVKGQLMQVQREWQGLPTVRARG